MAIQPNATDAPFAFPTVDRTPEELEAIENAKKLLQPALGSTVHRIMEKQPKFVDVPDVEELSTSDPTYADIIKCFSLAATTLGFADLDFTAIPRNARKRAVVVIRPKDSIVAHFVRVPMFCMGDFLNNVFEMRDKFVFVMVDYSAMGYSQYRD